LDPVNWGKYKTKQSNENGAIVSDAQVNAICRLKIKNRKINELTLLEFIKK